MQTLLKPEVALFGQSILHVGFMLPTWFEEQNELLLSNNCCSANCSLPQIFCNKF